MLGHRLRSLCNSPFMALSLPVSAVSNMPLLHPRVKVSIVGSLRDREVACSASDRQGSNFKSCVWRTVSSQSSHHPQEVLLAQFSLYVHKGGLKPDSFHLFHCHDRDGISVHRLRRWPSIKITPGQMLVFSGEDRPVSRSILHSNLWPSGDLVLTRVLVPWQLRKFSPNVAEMMVQRLRRWPSITATLGERLVFAGRH